jgi:hypothetical protein
LTIATLFSVKTAARKTPMADSLEQYGTELELWNSAAIANRTATFSIYEKNGSYTAIGLIAGNYISQSFDHYPSRQEVEDHFLSDPRFTIHINVVR